MSEESKGATQIVVALIGAIASVIVAFVAANTASEKKVKSTLSENRGQIDAVQAEIRSAREALAVVSENQAELNNLRQDIQAAKQLQSGRVPIGTIVASMVPPPIFSRAAGDVGDFDPTESLWVPADGRDVPGSGYTKLTASTAVPDLRGLFLRGLNYSEEGRTRRDNWADPDGADRTAGSLQEDELKSHDHITRPEEGNQWFTVYKRSEGTWPSERSGNRSKSRTEPSGGSESRPKNIAVFYYVRIND